jgi:tetratricopeptide (TPR) repeat protein
MGNLGNYYAAQYEGGNRDVIAVLEAEEANLLHARQLALRHAQGVTQDDARRNGWSRCIIRIMQGLDTLYGHAGRRGAWAALVNEMVPDFVEPATGGPRRGREEQWSLVTEYRIRLALEARQWTQAERLQRAELEWARQAAAPALVLPPERLDDAARNAIRMLGVSVEHSGHLQREQGKPDCVAAFEEAGSLYQRIGDRRAEANAALNLGRAHTEIPALRDLDQAERWYLRSLELGGERDRLGRSKRLSALGRVAWERFQEARAAERPASELATHLNAALGFYHQTLDLLPPNAVDDLAVAHNQLGICYFAAGSSDNALPHLRAAARYYEAAGDPYGAAHTRFNVAVGLRNAGRLEDALDYARAALRGYATYGDRAAAEMQETQRLIAAIEQAMRGA